MIDGCLAWQLEGLNPAEDVFKATANYLSAEDVMGAWLEERCIEKHGTWSSASTLFADWKEWCDANREYAGSQKRFSEALESHGFS